MAKVISDLDEIIIDPEFRDLLASSGDERSQLLDNIKVDGCRDALVVWSTDDGDILIDGHTRLSICKELEIPCRVESLHFDSRADVLKWMYHNQAGRRNMTKQKLSSLRGKLYNETKKEHGGKSRSQGRKPTKTEEKESSAQNEHLKTDEVIAEETGVSAATVRRDGKRVELLEKIIPKIATGYKSGKHKINDKALAKLGKLSHKEQAEVLKRVEAGKTEWNKYLDPKKSGRVRKAGIDVKKIDNLSGKLIRAVDEAHNASPNPKNHKGCIAGLRKFGEFWESWKKEVGK